LAHVQDLDDVAVDEAAAGPGLAEEAAAERVVLPVDQLEGDLALGALVDGRPDDAHGPLAEEAPDAVLPRDQGARGQSWARLPPRRPPDQLLGGFFPAFLHALGLLPRSQSLP